MSTDPQAAALLDRLTQLAGGLLYEPVVFRADLTMRARREELLEIAPLLRDSDGLKFDYLVDVTAVDWLERSPRFDVVYHLRSVALGHVLRVKVGADESVPSLAGIWELANWGEREVYDLFGITFDNHPDLRRILLPEDWDDGHPLRKDFPIGGYGVWAAENVPFR